MKMVHRRWRRPSPKLIESTASWIYRVSDRDLKGSGPLGIGTRMGRDHLGYGSTGSPHERRIFLQDKHSSNKNGYNKGRSAAGYGVSPEEILGREDALKIDHPDFSLQITDSIAACFKAF